MGFSDLGVSEGVIGHEQRDRIGKERFLGTEISPMGEGGGIWYRAPA